MRGGTAEEAGRLGGGVKEGRRAGGIKAKGTPCFIDVCLSTAFQKEANELKQDKNKRPKKRKASMKEKESVGQRPAEIKRDLENLEFGFMEMLCL